MSDLNSATRVSSYFNVQSTLLANVFNLNQKQVFDDINIKIWMENPK